MTTNKTRVSVKLIDLRGSMAYLELNLSAAQITLLQCNRFINIAGVQYEETSRPGQAIGATLYLSEQDGTPAGRVILPLTYQDRYELVQAGSMTLLNETYTVDVGR